MFIKRYKKIFPKLILTKAEIQKATKWYVSAVYQRGRKNCVFFKHHEKSKLIINYRFLILKWLLVSSVYSIITLQGARIYSVVSPLVWFSTYLTTVLDSVLVEWCRVGWIHGVFSEGFVPSTSKGNELKIKVGMLKFHGYIESWITNEEIHCLPVSLSLRLFLFLCLCLSVLSLSLSLCPSVSLLLSFPAGWRCILVQPQ